MWSIYLLVGLLAGVAIGFLVRRRPARHHGIERELSTSRYHLPRMSLDDEPLTPMDVATILAAVDRYAFNVEDGVFAISTGFASAFVYRAGDLRRRMLRPAANPEELATEVIDRARGKAGAADKEAT
jgi:hypothetical protein